MVGLSLEFFFWFCFVWFFICLFVFWCVFWIFFFKLVCLFLFKEGTQKLFPVRVLIKCTCGFREWHERKKKKKKNQCFVPAVRKN